MSTYQAAIYPSTGANPTVINADAGRKKIGVCFSGGGSRALTCAWGQLLGLSDQLDASGQPLIDQVRYISSVSGGSWAAVLYTFRPNTLTDGAFLGASFEPAQLYYGPAPAQGLDVTTMGASALGKVPQNFANLFTLNLPDNIIADFITLTLLKDIPLSVSAKWLWMYIVGENVLADFGLYTYQNSLLHRDQTPWQYPDAKFFSLSPAYAAQNIFSKTSPPPADAFVYARTDAQGNPAGPMLIINTNIVGQDCPGATMSGPLQIPTQVSPVAGGGYGANCCAGAFSQGGVVESFAFSSTLASASGTPVTADFPRTYSLVDITACSSAFYAASLAEPLKTVVARLQGLGDEELGAHLGRFLEKEAALLLPELRAKLAKLAGDLEGLEDLVPQYNYWPVSQTGQGAAANTFTQFTDGGDLENTGVAGLLAQTQGDVERIIAFVNGAEVLEVKNGQIIAATQMAPLFGVAYDATGGRFQSYLANGVNPFTLKTDPIGFLQIFDNSQGEFDALRQGLYAANGQGACSSPAFFEQELVLVNNQLVGISKGGTMVTLLWVQNAVVNDWQAQIVDPTLKENLVNGQQHGGTAEFADFPYYSTFLKIHQTAAETNTLAQMWSWCVGNPGSPLNGAIGRFFAAAS